MPDGVRLPPYFPEALARQEQDPIQHLAIAVLGNSRLTQAHVPNDKQLDLSRAPFDALEEIRAAYEHTAPYQLLTRLESAKTEFGQGSAYTEFLSQMQNRLIRNVRVIQNSVIETVLLKKPEQTSSLDFLIYLTTTEGSQFLESIIKSLVNNGRFAGQIVLTGAETSLEHFNILNKFLGIGLKGATISQMATYHLWRDEPVESRHGIVEPVSGIEGVDADLRLYVSNYNWIKAKEKPELSKNWHVHTNLIYSPSVLQSIATASLPI